MPASFVAAEALYSCGQHQHWRGSQNKSKISQKTVRQRCAVLPRRHRPKKKTIKTLLFAIHPGRRFVRLRSGKLSCVRRHYPLLRGYEHSHGSQVRWAVRPVFVGPDARWLAHWGREKVSFSIFWGCASLQFMCGVWAVKIYSQTPSLPPHRFRIDSFRKRRECVCVCVCGEGR